MHRRRTPQNPTTNQSTLARARGFEGGPVLHAVRGRGGGFAGARVRRGDAAAAVAGLAPRGDRGPGGKDVRVEPDGQAVGAREQVRQEGGGDAAFAVGGFAAGGAAAVRGQAVVRGRDARGDGAAVGDGGGGGGGRHRRRLCAGQKVLDGGAGAHVARLSGAGGRHARVGARGRAARPAPAPRRHVHQGVLRPRAGAPPLVRDAPGIFAAAAARAHHPDRRRLRLGAQAAQGVCRQNRKR
mmetsp:Transcript_4557/g.15725  ORF Transcript_4557/g.15725 Transcript_4557/m.15725 type:complete len:240 (+) Transcript_4557:2588-3307(+)